MKRLLCFLLIFAAFLCGCQVQSAPAETTPPITVQTEPLETEPTEPVRTGFIGTLEGYSFCHETERDRNWEEEILTVAQVFLEEHPWLVDDTTMTWEVESYISTPNWEWKSQYIPEKREAFLAAVNDLIPRIPEYGDEILTWEFQRILAGIGECHVHLFHNITEVLPVSFYPFYEDGALSIRIVSLPKAQEHLLYSRLTAINGIPIEEVLERMRPYSACDADTGFMGNATIMCFGNPPDLSLPSLLKTIGVMEDNAQGVELSFRNETGGIMVERFPVVSLEDYSDQELLDHSLSLRFPYSFAYYEDKPYWIDHWEAEKTLYIRLSQYDASQEEACLETNKEIYAVLNSVDTMDKIILDLRQNGGGSPSSRVLSGLMNFLRNPKVKQVYVLIDGGAFSMSVIASYNIRTEIPDAVFVGTPTGQGLPTGSVREYLKTPHGWLTVRSPGGMSVLESGDSFPCFEPDVFVYQTLEDYKNGIDTVLQYVMDQK